MGARLAIKGNSFDSILQIIPKDGEYELPLHSGLLLITNQSGSTAIAAAILRTDGTGEVLTDKESQVVFFSNTGGLSTVSVYKQSVDEHWKIINNRSLEAQVRISYVLNI